MKLKLFLLLTVLVFFSSTTSAQSTLSGHVTEVIDGSTFIFSASNTSLKIRLQYVEPPLPGQPLHETVRSHLTQMIKNKPVVVTLKTLAQGVSSGKVLVAGVDVAMQMLRDGAVWYDVPDAGSQSDQDRALYLEMGQMAKSEKRGVWGIADIQPAWAIKRDRAKADNDRRERELKEAMEKFARSGLPNGPSIGMPYSVVTVICGSVEGDKVETRSTDGGQTIRLRLVPTTRRSFTKCDGVFEFDESEKLVEMRREEN